jgi:hypothetical protein
MLNVNQITSRLAKLPDQALKQYAQMHKDDPYTVSLAISESNRRKEIRAGGQQRAQQQPKVADAAIAQMDAPQQNVLPEQQGIGALPAPNMRGMAAGGIVAFKEKGKVEAAPDFETALDMEGVRDPVRRAFLKAIYSKETGGGTNTTTSNRGAVGHMQILPETFKSVASPGMKIDNALDNMRAGIRYASQGYQLAGGDPKLAAAYYYGGPGGLDKAKKGIAVSDPKNPSYPTTLEYGDDVARRMAMFKPVTGQIAAAPAVGNSIISSANAGELPQAPAQVAPPKQTQVNPQGRFPLPARTSGSPQAPENGVTEEVDRSVLGQLKRIYEGMGSAGERIAPRQQLIGPNGLPVEDTRGFFERAATGVGIPQEFQRNFSNTLNAFSGYAAPLRIPKAMGTLSAAEEAARIAKIAQANEAAAAAAAKVANVRLPATASNTRGGVAALSKEDQIRRGLDTPVPVPPQTAAGLEALSDAEKAKRGLTPQGTQFSLSPEAIEMNRRVAAARNTQKTAPAVSKADDAGKTYPLSDDAVKMNQKVAAAKNAQAVRNMKADKEAALNAAKIAEETKLVTKADEGLEAINAAQKANKINQVVKPLNTAVDATRTSNAISIIGDGLQTSGAEQAAPVNLPPDIDREKDNLLRRYPVTKREEPAPQQDDMAREIASLQNRYPAPPSSPKEIIKMAKEETPKSAATKGFTSDDWLNLGFNLLAGKSQYAMENLGTAGVATLAAKREREKDERTAALTQAINAPEAERIINRLMQEKGIDYASAMKLYFETKNYADVRRYLKELESEAKKDVAQTGAGAKVQAAGVSAAPRDAANETTRAKNYLDAIAGIKALQIINPKEYNRLLQVINSAYPEFKNQQGSASSGVTLLGVKPSPQ